MNKRRPLASAETDDSTDASFIPYESYSIHPYSPEKHSEKEKCIGLTHPTTTVIPSFSISLIHPPTFSPPLPPSRLSPHPPTYPRPILLPPSIKPSTQLFYFGPALIRLEDSSHSRSFSLRESSSPSPSPSSSPSPKEFPHLYPLLPPLPGPKPTFTIFFLISMYIVDFMSNK